MPKFDFPIGIPAAYAESIGVTNFKEFLMKLGVEEWAEFYGVCEKPSEVVIVLLEGRLEAAYPFTQAFAELGDLLGAEHQYGNAKDDQQVRGLKQTFKHVAPHFSQ